MKKIILLIIFVLSLYADQKFLISGISEHGKSKDSYGEKFKSVHYGLGYEYSSDADDDIYSSLTFLAFSDSYANIMYSITYGYNYVAYNRNNLMASIGAEFGLAYKNMKKSKAEIIDNKKVYTENGFRYRAVPIAFIPKIIIEYKSVSINFLYVPKFEYKIDNSSEMIIYEVLYINFGIKI